MTENQNPEIPETTSMPAAAGQESPAAPSSIPDWRNAETAPAAANPAPTQPQPAQPQPVWTATTAPAQAPAPTEGRMLVGQLIWGGIVVLAGIILVLTVTINGIETGPVIVALIAALGIALIGIAIVMSMRGDRSAAPAPDGNAKTDAAASKK